MAVVEYQAREGIAWITLNRPERLNAVNRETRRRLCEICKEVDGDADVRVAVLTGAGDRAFSSGFDLRDEQAAPSGRALLGEGEESAQLALLRVGKPTIAAIHGFCLGGSLDLALACDLRIAAENAALGFPEVHWNLPDGFAVALLMRAVPLAHAMDILLRAHRLDAVQALRIGLVNEVVPRERLLARCGDLAREIAAQAPLAMRAMKALAYESLHANLAEVMASQGQLMRLLGATEDAGEGRRAFAERRDPQYKGT
ncbi:MAG: enoyl-CoA hydratase/isomerase family protein [Chloroflexi bacterium]|nr:enoyl-CoA hydratase/isomerase family protein [Chloroflexota bacterium]